MKHNKDFLNLLRLVGKELIEEADKMEQQGENYECSCSTYTMEAYRAVYNLRKADGCEIHITNEVT